MLCKRQMNNQSQAVGKYSCSQLFGYKGKSQKLIQEDNLTTLKFDHSGKYLALGDRAGRVIAFQTDSDLQQQQEYQYFFQFQAQSAQFDKLKNYKLPEEVLFIDWLRPQGKYLKIITANSHTIKLWKIFQKEDKKLAFGASQDLSLPQFQAQQPTFSINVQKKYQNPSFSPLNTVQVSQNEQYIFTADQNSICLWNIQKNKRAFSQTELKKENQHKFQLSQKVTCASLSCQRESLQVLGTNKGKLNLIDSRISFTDPTIMDFKCARDNKNFLSEIINQYSAVNFFDEDRKIVTRDLISVKIWDTRNNREPFLDIYVDETIQSHVCQLFEAQVLQDKFKLSNVKGNILSGNYSNSFQMIDPSTGQNVQYQLDYGQDTRARKVGVGQKKNPFSCEAKVLAHDYNEATGQLAVSTRNCFFIFSEESNN